MIGVLQRASQHTPSSFLSCTVTALVSGRVGIGMAMPFPLRMIFDFEAMPDLSCNCWIPSGVKSLSLYLNPPLIAFQHGFVGHVSPAGICATSDGGGRARAS